MERTTLALRIAKRRWIGGLLWTSQEHNPSSSEIAQEAVHLDANLYVRRRPRFGVVGEAERHEVGYGSSSQPIHGTHYSLGATLASSKEGKWSATYDLGDGVNYLYLAVLDGNSIVPDEFGEFIGTRDDVDKAKEAHSRFRLEHDEISKETLESILSQPGVDLDRVTVLKDSKSKAKQAGIGLVAGGIVAVGMVVVVRHIQKEKILAAQAAERRQLALMAAQQRPVKKQVNPLISNPDPLSLLEACERNIQNIPSSYYGWEVSEIHCAPTGISVVWRASKDAWYEKTPPGVQEAGGNEVVWNKAWKLPKGTLVYLKLSDAEAVLRDMAMEAGGRLTIGQIKTTNVPGSKAKKPPASPFGLKHNPFTMATSWAPWVTPISFIPGIRLTSVSVNGKGTDWALTGEIYGK